LAIASIAAIVTPSASAILIEPVQLPELEVPSAGQGIINLVGGTTDRIECYAYTGSTFDTCKSSTSSTGGQATNVGLYYCQSGSTFCTATTGSVHTNLKKSWDGDYFNGDWTGYGQFRSGAYYGCPDPNPSDCSYGSSYTGIKVVASWLGDAIFAGTQISGNGGYGGFTDRQ
jgi:hypothetical protein